MQNYSFKTLIKVLCYLKKKKGSYNLSTTELIAVQQELTDWRWDLKHKSVTNQRQKNSLWKCQNKELLQDQSRRETLQTSTIGMVLDKALSSREIILDHQSIREDQNEVDYFRSKHMLLLSSWLTDAKYHIQWSYKTISVVLS